MAGKELILVSVGPDRVGLVKEISEFITEHRCNIEDSRMAVLAGEFAFILLLSGEEEHLSEIAQGIENLAGATGLQIWVKHPSGRKSKEPSLPYRLVASSMDHPGIVYRLSNSLKALGINIDSMETHTYAAPVSGTAIFRMEARISIPAGQNINSLRSTLKEIEREENIDVEMVLMKD